jgi:hypothetical protein
MYRYALIKDGIVLDIIYAPEDFVELIEDNYDYVVRETTETGVIYVHAQYADGIFTTPDELLYPAEIDNDSDSLLTEEPTE